MNKIYLQIYNLNEVESLRQSFLANLNLQTFDEGLKADLRIEFENWLNGWSATAYRSGVTPPTYAIAG